MKRRRVRRRLRRRLWSREAGGERGTVFRRRRREQVVGRPLWHASFFPGPPFGLPLAFAPRRKVGGENAELPY